MNKDVAKLIGDRIGIREDIDIGDGGYQRLMFLGERLYGWRPCFCIA